MPQVDDSTALISVRVSFLWSYQVLLPKTVLIYYGFDESATNDVARAVFEALFNNVTYAQLYRVDQQGL